MLACDDKIISLQERMEGVEDNADMEEFYDIERHLLYASCTRAKDRLLVTYGELTPWYLEDLESRNNGGSAHG